MNIVFFIDFSFISHSLRNVGLSMLLNAFLGVLFLRRKIHRTKQLCLEVLYNNTVESYFSAVHLVYCRIHRGVQVHFTGYFN